MRKKYFLLLLIINFSFGQAIKQDKSIRASMVYGYFTGIETTLAKISELNPNFRSEVNHLNLLLTTNFGQSKKNAIKYLNGIDNWKDEMKQRMDSLKQLIETNVLFSTNEETTKYLEELEKNLKGNISSPMLENVLSFQYENQPSKEFSNGYTYTFNSKGHSKSKNTELILTIPKSWSSQEGKQPNVIQLFTSDCGNGSSSISVMTQEMPYSKEELGNLTFEEIDKLYKEDIFTEEYAKNFIEGKFISYKPMNIAGRAGFLIIYEVIKEKMGMKIKMRNNAYIFHDMTYLHFINCGIGTPNVAENLEEKVAEINPLFFMIVNSIVIPKKNTDVINLKGTEYQKIVDIKIADKSYEFILDTGASISLIGKNIIANLLENGIITNRNFLGKDYIQTADGKKHLVEFWNVPSIIINGKKINDVDFTVMEGANIKPLLGMNILNKLNIYKIDLENYKIYLKNE
ncbi:retropepsin-like aspartic protease [Flavobacterium sp.]|uniref:retropepsin-like aspartic protease n=1 Tax=Flavobacterium sp. TaxID=239 RepID=UPI0022BD4913|nr:retropepsin-like aspartic protease [Flavobacterium sp.]MCZ8089022.1 retropepsin-like aspartic protease [Flavobacterium sp.]